MVYVIALSEKKYGFLTGESDLVTDWIGHYCIDDPVYPLGMVSSIYFDTPDFAAYTEKRSGDYIKTKLRLRWYSAPDQEARDAVTQCYLEVKQKQGSLRRKNRVPLELSAAALNEDLETSVAIAALADQALGLGHPLRGILLPMLRIRYLRRRFLEPLSQARIAIDTAIRCDAVNSAFVRGVVPVQLDSCVLEVKGDPSSGSPAIEGIRGRLVSTSFSKYARCFDLIQASPGRSRSA